MKLITCGTDKLTIINTASNEIEWSFFIQESPDLSEDERSWAAWYTGKSDECKPLDGGKRILVTAVSGLVCVITPETNKLKKLAWVPGAHSAEQITEHLFAIAVSLHPVYPPGAPEITGNYIALYDDRKPCEELSRDACKSAHGAVWEAGTEILWTLGFETVRSYSILTDSPKLIQTGSYPLPDLGGHDLSPVPGKRELYVSTGRHVFIFNMETGTFEKHSEIGSCLCVKSISHHPETDQVVYIGADPGETKTNTIRFLGSDKIINRTGTYKARWMY